MWLHYDELYKMQIYVLFIKLIQRFKGLIWVHKNLELFDLYRRGNSFAYHWVHRQVSNIRHFSRHLSCWSLRCSWSMACRRCSNYIFIHNLTPGFNGLDKDNYKMGREAYKFWDLVQLIVETLRYVSFRCDLVTHRNTGVLQIFYYLTDLI